MAEFGNYLLASSVCTALFYMGYYLFLRRLTFFRLNRLYLLASLVLSLFIPLLNFNIEVAHDNSISQFIPAWNLYQEPDSAAWPYTPGSKSPFSLNTLLAVVYFIGVLLVFTRLIVSLLIIAKVYNGTLITRSGNTRIAEGRGSISNCSFFNTIFLLPGTINNEEYSQIIAHEKCHIRLYHTWDKLFVHFVQVIFWFNPFMYLYRKSIDEIHEFEVDALLTERTDKKIYAGFLLNLATQKSAALVNNFSSAPLKTRIKMIFTQRSGRLKRAFYAIGIPIMLLAVLSFSVQQNEELVNKFMTTRNTDNNTGSNTENAVQKNETPVSLPGIQAVKPVGKLPDTYSKPVLPDQKAVNLYKQTQQVQEKENTEPTPAFNFLVRTTIKEEDGKEYDRVELRFGKNYHLIGGVTKGGKIRYLIGGKEYQEEEIKKFTPADVAGLSCPCSVQGIDKKEEPLISGIYEGVIKISNAN